MGIISNINSKPINTVEGSGSYTVPSTAFAYFSGHVSLDYWVSERCGSGVIPPEYTSPLYITQRAEQMLLALDSITVTTSTAADIAGNVSWGSVAQYTYTTRTSYARINLNGTPIADATLDIQKGHNDANGTSVSYCPVTGNASAAWSVSEYDA